MKKSLRLVIVRFQLIPAPAKTPFFPCHVSPNVAFTGEFRSVTDGGDDAVRRRQRSTGGRQRHRVAQIALAVQFRGEPQALARRHPGADAPAEPVGQIDAVRVAADDEAAVAGHLDALVDFLADDRVEGEIRLAGADARVVVLGRSAA